MTQAPVASRDTARVVRVDPDAQKLLAGFAYTAAERLRADGWTMVGEQTADGSSIFLGEFERSVDEAFVATVEFILESGPVVRGGALLATGPVKTRRVHAVVGGELGVCHLPTREFLRWLRARCDTTVALDLAELFEQRGMKLPVITDQRSAEDAARILAAKADREAMAFACRLADVDRMLAYLTSGSATGRTAEFVGMFVPALLAASGRPGAPVALTEYRGRFAHSPDELEEFDEFADRLRTWLA